MKDIDIRNCLLSSLERKYKKDENTLIIEELGLCQGDARIDIAVVNGALYGYEIKSDKDTLKRLNRQLDVYSKVLDFVALITSSRHLSKVEKIIPAWWGLYKAYYENNDLRITEVRPMQANEFLDAGALVQLLWRDEALEVLKKHNLQRGFVDKPRSILWQRIAECLSLSQISEEVRYRIKTRQNWRVAVQ